MSVLGRIANLLDARMNALLDRFDDPGEALDYGLDLLWAEAPKVSGVVGDLVMVRSHLETEVVRLRGMVAAFGEMAEGAVAEGLDDSAREALARGIVFDEMVAALVAKGNELTEEESLFRAAASRLEQALAALAVRREQIKADYAFSGDRARIDEAIAAVRRDVEEVRGALRRADEALAVVRGRSRMIDGLLASGVMTDLGTTPESLEVELARVRGSARVECDLDRIRRPGTGGRPPGAQGRIRRER